MKTTSIFSMLALAATMAVGTASITSCSKKDSPAPEDQGTPLPAPSAAKFAELREQALAGMTTTGTFTAAPYSSPGLSTEKGSVATLPLQYSCLKKQDEEAVVGDFAMSLTEIYDRGSMVLAHKPLMAKNAEGKLVPLVSGGQYFMEAKLGNEILKPNYALEVGIPTSLTGGDDEGKTSWKGNVDDNGGLTYGGFTSSEGDGSMLIVNNEYLVYRLQFGWTGIGRFYIHDGATTAIKVRVPEGYNAQNAAVYLAYAGEKHLLAQLYSYDAAGKSFSEPAGFVPVGKDVHVIFVSESGGKFVHAVKTVKVTANTEVSIAHRDLATIDADKLAEKVNALD